MPSNFVARWGIQIFVSSLIIILGMLWENDNTKAIEVSQISEFSNSVNSAKDLQPVAEVISQNTPAPTAEKEPDIELTVIDKLLNEPVFSPFRREGIVKDSTRPVYVITGEEMEAQGARNVREALRFLPGILGDGIDIH